MKLSSSSIILVLVALLFSACHSRVLYENTISLPEEGWNQDNFLFFKIPAEDTINQYEISLVIRNDARYEFSNLFLFINTTAPSGLGIRDTLEITLADERGNWIGRGIGGKHTLTVPFKGQVIFPQSGNYTVEIEHGMRTIDLQYITDVGVSIKNLK